MHEFEPLTETERLLLMAAAVEGLGPETDLGRANTVRVVDRVLRWRGLAPREIEHGWWDDPDHPQPAHTEVYEALVRMTHQMTQDGRGRAPERGGAPLFEGGGNWGMTAIDRPPSWPHYNSCRLTSHGLRIAAELLDRHPEYGEGG